MAAMNYTQMEGCCKISDFEYDLTTVNENLKFREKNGKKFVHGNYVKSLVEQRKIIDDGIPTKLNAAGKLHPEPQLYIVEKV